MRLNYFMFGFIMSIVSLAVLSVVVIGQQGGDNENHIPVTIKAPLTEYYTSQISNHSRVLSVEVREHETEIIINIEGLSSEQKRELYADMIRLQVHFENIYATNTRGIPLFNHKGSDICLYDEGLQNIVRYYSFNGRVQTDVGDTEQKCL